MSPISGHGGSKTAAEGVVTDQAAPAADAPNGSAASNTAADKTAPDKQGSDKPASDKPAADKATAADKPSADKRGSHATRRELLLGAVTAGAAAAGAVYVTRSLPRTMQPAHPTSAASRISSARPVATVRKPTHADWAALRKHLSTRDLIRPGDRGYVQARRLFEPRFDAIDASRYRLLPRARRRRDMPELRAEVPAAGARPVWRPQLRRLVHCHRRPGHRRVRDELGQLRQQHRDSRRGPGPDPLLRRAGSQRRGGARRLGSNGRDRRALRSAAGSARCPGCTERPATTSPPSSSWWPTVAL